MVTEQDRVEAFLGGLEQAGLVVAGLRLAVLRLCAGEAVQGVVWGGAMSVILEEYEEDGLLYTVHEEARVIYCLTGLGVLCLDRAKQLLYLEWPPCHDWDTEAWAKSGDPAYRLVCRRCGFEARTEGVDVPGDCVCGLEETYFDPSDHTPHCPYFQAPRCRG